MSLDVFKVVGYHIIVDFVVGDPYMGEKDQGIYISRPHILVFLIFQEYFENRVQEDSLQASFTGMVTCVILEEECMLPVFPDIFSAGAHPACVEVSFELVGVGKFTPWSPMAQDESDQAKKR